MKAARLEELAVWCDRQKETLQAHEITDIADNYAGLARCARGWLLWRPRSPKPCTTPPEARHDPTHPNGKEAPDGGAGAGMERNDGY